MAGFFFFVVVFCLFFPDSGIGLENGVFVSAIVPGSPAAREGSLSVGDRLITVSLFHKYIYILL